MAPPLSMEIFMKALVTVFSAKGFYHETTVIAATVQGIMDKTRHALDDMPDEVDDVEFVDWTKIRIDIER